MSKIKVIIHPSKFSDILKLCSTYLCSRNSEIVGNQIGIPELELLDRIIYLLYSTSHVCV